MTDYLLKQGDCIKVMDDMIKNGFKVHSVVTDPPYHLASIVSRFGKPNSVPTVDNSVYRRSSTGFMGKEWDGGDIAFQKDVWQRCYELLLPGGYLLAFSATRNYHRMACAIEDAGFEIRDQIGWLYGTGFPKTHDLGDGWRTGLKPGWEPICVARKAIEGTNRENREKYGTGGFNIEACRVPISDEDKQTNHNKIKNNPTAGGFYFGNNVYGKGQGKIVGTQTQLDRFPANIIHDGSEEVEDAFPNGSSRFFYSAKTSKAEKMTSKTSWIYKGDNISLEQQEEIYKYIGRPIKPMEDRCQTNINCDQLSVKDVD